MMVAHVQVPSYLQRANPLLLNKLCLPLKINLKISFKIKYLKKFKYPYAVSMYSMSLHEISSMLLRTSITRRAIGTTKIIRAII